MMIMPEYYTARGQGRVKALFRKGMVAATGRRASRDLNPNGDAAFAHGQGLIRRDLTCIKGRAI
jgi:hypothetical protein